MSGLSPVGLFTVVFVISLVLVVGGFEGHNGGDNGGDFKKVHHANGPVKRKPKPVHLLKCVQCQGESFEECSKSEVSKPCPPGSSARACIVKIQQTNAKMKIEKQCTMKKACDRRISKRPKACVHGNITGDERCNFCCETDDCNKGWPKPQFDQHCTNWTAWGECNAHCGPGKQARNMTCRMEIVGYNLWHENTIGSALPSKESEKTTNESAVSFLPKLPANVTEPKVKWQHRPCQIRPCKTGEIPVVKPMPPFNRGSEGLQSSVLFLTLWFTLAWYL
ncbi:uncharacterized protein LOC135502152 [Lineus longissimus]|uniref:uncharacterized protein LOC135502152 n=1 Tax=Lineus longissimus TaxID=88925 RepID=UPI002B4D05B0